MERISRQRGWIGNYKPKLIQPAYSPEDATGGGRAASPQTTPTYDTSGEAVHPDVYDAGVGQTWNGYRYWLVMTPYPGGDSQYENPSVLASSDGDAWEVPAGLTNPITPKPTGGFNADTDVIVDQSNTMWVLYRNNSAGDGAVAAKSSTDGINWSAEVELFSATVDDGISPAIVWDGSQYKCFYVNTEGDYPYKVHYRTASAVNGTWSDPVVCSVGCPYAYKFIWHIDVIRADGLYYMIANYSTAALYFAVSEDGITWYVGSEPIIPRGAVGQWDRNDYRACLVRTASGFDVWYSANDNGSPEAWRIGRTSIAWSV